MLSAAVREDRVSSELISRPVGGPKGGQVEKFELSMNLAQ